MGPERRLKSDEIERRLNSIENTTTNIYKILNGNGKPGIVTKVALHEQHFKSIPSPNSLRFQASVGGGIVMVLSMIGYAIIQFFKSN